MREILFRGKDKYSDRWFEGFVFNKNKDKLGFYNNCLSFRIDEVIPETVGQFTGLTDKNGKKIFEGDIIKANFCINGSKQTFLVIYNNGMFLFDNKSITVPKHEIYKVEVIGNIHDNPELLKEQ